MNRAFAVGLLLAQLIACQGQQRGGVSANEAVPIVLGILDGAKVSGSLEYWGRCDAALPDFPKIKSVQGRASAAEALRAVFADDASMQVIQEPGGIIRMMETDVPQDLLNIRIRRVHFKSDYDISNALYDPRDALRAILL